RGNALAMGLAVLFVMTSSSILTSLIYLYILIPLGIQYMRIVVFILVIAAFVQFVEMLIRKLSEALYRALSIYLPLITTNCAVLGVALINTDVEGYPLLPATVNGMATGIGFMLVLFLMAAIRERLELADLPRAFQGLPIAFVTAALLALAFQAFSGMRL
ncbi:Na+-translocating ferredoxin:NAD+ oxidoreductase subunit A, partial [Candidatus Hakubella thermalkaliphila]